MTVGVRIFKVTGNGQFPFDMLRYDACWPETTKDAILLQTPEDHVAFVELRTITLVTASKNAPTAKRWESFLWRNVP